MQQVPVIRWEEPACLGDHPVKRSGHSLTRANSSFAYMFGGCVDFSASKFYVKAQAPGPTNELYKVDLTSNTESFWTKLEFGSEPCPNSRWNHTASYTENGKIIIFGGFSGSKASPHLNDVWVFDTKNESWIEIEFCSHESSSVPEPRGAHSASLVGQSIYIFGGYGGANYSRRDFNDLYTLDISKWKWNKVKTTGAPSPRSGHQCAVVNDKLFVMGGWCASQQFHDIYCLDPNSLLWEKIESASGDLWGPRRWNFTAVTVRAVPTSKIFIFGGNCGDLSAECPRAELLNDILILENADFSTSPRWMQPMISGVKPSPRSDTQMIYLPETGRLVLFGGWSNRWLCDMQSCQVDEVVGPPYHIESLQCLQWKDPIGPVTGDTPVIAYGMGFDFVNEGKVTVRFACPTGSIDVDGEVKNDNEITFCTPNYQDHGPINVEIRLKLGKYSFTNAYACFSFFSVTDCSQTIAFGPGLLQGNLVGSLTSFVIQAKDMLGNNRVCGMDEFRVNIHGLEMSLSDDESSHVDPTITDCSDGSYLVEFVLPSEGNYKVEVKFFGTFSGNAGEIRGSPFIVSAKLDANENANNIDGPLLLDQITSTAASLKSFCSTSKKGLVRKTEVEDIKGLVSIKEHLRNVSDKSKSISLTIDTNHAALLYLKRKAKIFSIDKIHKCLEESESAWIEVNNLVPKTLERITIMNHTWREKVHRNMKDYNISIHKYRREFQQLSFWKYYDSKGEKITDSNAMSAVNDAEKALHSDLLVLDENSHLCKIFDLGDLIGDSQNYMHEMKSNLHDVRLLWSISHDLDKSISSVGSKLWADVNCDVLDMLGKSQLKSVKAINSTIRWSSAFQDLERHCKTFLSTIPLISLLKSKCMRPRHWIMVLQETGGRIDTPSCNPNLKLTDVLSLQLHKFVNEVEEICDQAAKEEKMEKTLHQISTRWLSIEFTMSPFRKIDGDDIPLLSIIEEDFEALENDQLVIQGMLASRFLSQFEIEVNAWNKSLYNVNEIFILVSEIQRTWSYLEPLFMHSDEVKRELPEDATRFVEIDVNIRNSLVSAWKIKNIRNAFNVEGLFVKFERIQEQLEICKKSLADFLDGRRRQFPRYYFVSEADLLDMLSNGSTPSKILSHIPKVYLSTKTLTFGEETSSTNRPIATYFVSGVGEETCAFEPPVALEGKVEHYMQIVLDAQKKSIFETVKRSLLRYSSMSRPEWLLTKDNESKKSVDPAQTTLLVLAINYVKEVEYAFQRMIEGDAKALHIYAEKQIHQLNDLIKLTQTDLSKGDRTRIMVSITMDAHGRDIVQKMIRNKVDSEESFMWQSQLKHKFRIPPPQARYQYRDPELRGNGGERVEIAICDAILPYDYEYLGNGPRLVITPLTDRIYVTATQALNLKMGCAPAGPAGTGKTETTKDLANALAKLIYVINCSPEMDYKGLGNIFKGVASSGAWVCFDEFNRLIPEVLSVCTVQFKAVCDGIAADSTRIRVEGDEILLDPTCGAFITMNPGYLGRSELPEGLKALFRPMTVMVPDLTLICENMLMAEGFVTAKELASKFYCLYSLLKALLSAQLHYDWGLRAIKSVLVVAGGFKRAEPKLAEDALLMRALRDFNIPKIVREDEVVFFGLLGDLFPGIDPPRKRDERLESFVVQACLKLGNDPDETFCLKVIQMEELLAIRHCVFLMGPAGSGKSQCWRTLKTARDLRDSELPTKVVDLNPKSVKTEELYGYINMATREWKDGLLSNIMRSLSSAPDEKPKWIMLDGDLDANWIESMNSVMDDNRMLTLASNERIPLLPHMRMIFEIRDLKHASPATVSRAGILFISTDDGTQWRSLINSWISKLSFNDFIIKTVRSCFDKYLADAFLWLAINVKSIIPIEDVNRVQVLLYMLDGCLKENHTHSPENIESVFVYCAVWALGSSLSVGDDGIDHRKLFSDWWRSNWNDVKFPSRETVFDYYLDEEMTFDSWTKSPFFFSVEFDSSNMSMNQVTVPTPETCSISYWMNLLADMRRPVMLAGPAGTGKTQLVNGMLNKCDPVQVLSTTINFNFYTNAGILATTMGLPLEKKTGSNFAPPGSAKLIYFMDDINLPEVDPYNTQSAIAHLRQHMEYEHCYDLQKLTLKNITNTQVVSCMNPTAGCFFINPRLQRWFATFAIGLPGPTSLLTIYQTFLDGHLKNFSSSIQEQSNTLIKAALGLHALVSSNFRKTAANFHYEFNIRHISNVFQGLLISSPDQFNSADKFILLWLHESERVYGDRLVSTEDLAKYNNLAQGQCKKVYPSFQTAKFYAQENAEPLLFCHFAETIEEPIYDQVTSLSNMSKLLDGALNDYNESYATMDLVLFEDAMKHVARIVRIIRNEGGHALLVGVGGSGKQSLARLAAYICGYSAVQIVISSTYSINDLKDDLKVMYNKAGVKGEGILFLLTDSQITNERFLIYLNDLLSSGNIPDLFAPDEVDSIVNGVTSCVKSLGLVPERSTCWNYFMNQIKKNLHVCLCFSPVGDDFRNRSRKFPALVNCTVIDVFQPWPKDALLSVGKKFLSNIELGEPGTRRVVENFLPFSFDAVKKTANDYKLKEQRYVYVTPKSFLELLKLYEVLLKKKRGETGSAIARLESGLLKLRETSESVFELEEELKVMLEDAASKKEKAESIAEVVAKEKSIVEVQTSNAQVESEQVAKIATEVSKRQKDTKQDLAKAEPAVEAAMSALDTLDQKDLSSCKGMLKPPPKLDEVFAATMCLLAGIMPSIVVQKSGKVKDTSWEAAKKQLMGNIKDYMVNLKAIKAHIDENTINQQNFKEVRQYIEKDYFNVETIKAKNQAAAGLCSFVLNIVTYYDIVTTVEPKRKALAEANAQLAEANAKLRTVQDNVAMLEDKLAKLTNEFEAANRSKQEAMDMVSRGETKLNLAQRLTSALVNENKRWAENVLVMREDEKLLVGDVLLASAFISYIGPFTKPFRVHLMDNVFRPYLTKEFRKTAGEGSLIPMSDDIDPLKVLVSQAEIAGWNADALPADVVSLENGAIVSSTSRWPLLIDPQLQGIKWLKNKESASHRNLQVVRLGQKDLIPKLEIALEQGFTILIENIGESLEAVLNPVIQRATIKRGSRYFIKVGEKECDFHPEFKLYLHTKLSNPHYPPEIQAETTLINFTVTMLGLEDQLLNLVVQKERPDLSALGESLIEQQNGFIIKMKELEDNILSKLALAEGDITEDVALIESLEETKRISDDILQKSELVKDTQSSILVISEKYRSVAKRSSLIFFLMNDLVKIHTYYIYSLSAFQQVFFRGIEVVSTSSPDGSSNKHDESDDRNQNPINEEKVDDMSIRCKELMDSITSTVFNYIRRGLFEIDKLTVAALLTLKILVSEEKVNQKDVDYLLHQVPISGDPGNMGPLHEWMPEALWPKVKALEKISRFKSLGDDMQSDSEDWNAWFDDERPEVIKLPGSYEILLTPIDRLILLRSMRPDRLMKALSTFVCDTMGREYISQKPFNMKSTFDETSCKIPTFFVLFAGVDPTPWVEVLGREKGISSENKRFVNISMGQGQEAPAEAIIKKFAKEGGWVMLQNCHLMNSWVPRLERILEVVSEDAHQDFRCFLSAEPPPLSSMKNMPESLMQTCIKVANEAPADIQSNLIRAWDNFSEETIEACSKPDAMKACLFSLSWFHAIVCGRRRFGPIGWSRKYSFNTGDLVISSNVLASYLENNHDVPWDDLRYIFGEIMYGGHITDTWDRRTCNTYLKVYQDPEIFNEMDLAPGFKSPNPSKLSFSNYISYVEKKMPSESPVLFGLHPNAEIGYLTNSTERLFLNILVMSGAGGDGDAATQNDTVKETMKILLNKIPDEFEMVSLSLKAKPLLSSPSGPFIVVAMQECGRMNVLLKEMRKSLTDLEKGLKGQLNMSQEMEDLLCALKINQWPGRNVFSKCTWEKLAWPSQKNLLSQFEDMICRVKQLQHWVSDLETPKSMWLSGLFNPNSYLTAVQQVTARKTGIALDKMSIETHVTKNWDVREVNDHAVDGTYIHGLFIEGARWQKGEDCDEIFDVSGTKCAGSLCESRLKELIPPMPVVYVKAVPIEPHWEPTSVGYLRDDPFIYECPVYMTTFRGPTYIFLATLRTKVPSFKWVMSGVALILQTDE